MSKLVKESLNEYLNEDVNLPKAGQLIDKLLKNYKFVKFETDVQKRPEVYEKIKKGYEAGNGTLPNGLHGAAIVIVSSDKTGAEVNLISMEKALIKQMMNLINKNWEKFSTSEKGERGHKTKDGWDDVETNKGSKGSAAADKTSIKPVSNMTWKNKKGEQQIVYQGVVFLY